MSSFRKRTAAKLHLLTAREVLNAADGDHSDGGGLYLRVRGPSSGWVLRFTSPTGRRREMGLGTAHRTNAQQAGATLTSARDLAHRCREHLRVGVEPAAWGLIAEAKELKGHVVVLLNAARSEDGPKSLEDVTRSNVTGADCCRLRSSPAT